MPIPPIPPNAHIRAFYSPMSSGRNNPEIENNIYITEIDRLNELRKATTTLVERIGTFDFHGLLDNATMVMHFPQSLDDDIGRYIAVLKETCPVCIAADIHPDSIRNPIMRCCVAWRECDIIYDNMREQYDIVDELHNILYDFEELLKQYPLTVISLTQFIFIIDAIIKRTEKRHWHYVYKRSNILKKWWMRWNR